MERLTLRLSQWASRAGMAALTACVLTARAASADGPPAVSPAIHSRRYLSRPTLSSWAGPERVTFGEIEPAAPWPPAAGLVQGPDTQLRTRAYVQTHASFVRRDDGKREAWGLLEMQATHELRGGAVASALFRVDVRDKTAIQSILAVIVPLPKRLGLVPTLGVAARSDVVPNVLGGAELRFDRTQSVGLGIGFEATGWTYDRARWLGSVAGVQRLSERVVVEQRIAMGTWAGPRVQGDLALQCTAGALQMLGPVAFHERVTLAHGPRIVWDGTPPGQSARSIDVAIAVQRSIGPRFGIGVEFDGGAQWSAYRRWGAQLTLYGAPF